MLTRLRNEDALFILRSQGNDEFAYFDGQPVYEGAQVQIGGMKPTCRYAGIPCHLQCNHPIAIARRMARTNTYLRKGI